MEVRKGQKISLDEDFLTIKFERKSGALEIDTSAFLLQAGGKVSGDDDFVFYGNPRHKSGGVIYFEGDSIEIDLKKIPRDVEKISLTATIYEPEKRKQNFSHISNAALNISGTRTGNEIIFFPLQNFTTETAIVLGEIYRYKGVWKFGAVGAGFNGGLKALCENFGIEVIDEPETPPAPPPKISVERSAKKNSAPQKKSSPPARKSPTPIVPPPAPINLSPPQKIEVNRGEKVKIRRRGNSSGEISINLKWKKSGGQRVAGRLPGRSIDLDLCCLYELQDGEIGAVQALGNLFGSFSSAPYILHEGDDRTGNVSDGETIRVNGKFIRKIRRILIFTFIYSGAADWSEAQGVVTVKCPGSPDLVVRMDEYGSRKNTCAVALLENVGDTFSVEKIVRFYKDSQEMDDAFDWGLEWARGKKD